MADSEKRTLANDQEVYAEAVKIVRILVGLTIAEASNVLRACDSLIRSTITIEQNDVAAIAKGFHGQGNYGIPRDIGTDCLLQMLKKAAS